VKRLTELQGGRVAVASEGIGRGTEVTIHFPLATANHHTPVSTSSVTAATVQELRGLRLLIVEDVDDSREATRLLLEQLGADVLEAKDGLEGLQIATSAAPDVVLCDLRMPRMDGFEFVRALHERCGEKCPPVIAISGLASRVDHVRTESAGFEAHLDKPFDDVGLLGALSAVIARRRR
jgi:CheY-like chemotaxis protein